MSNFSFHQLLGVTALGVLAGLIGSGIHGNFRLAKAEQDHQLELAQVATESVVRGYCHNEACNGIITVVYPGHRKDFTVTYQVKAGELLNESGRAEQYPLPHACTGYVAKDVIDTAGVCSFKRDGGDNY